MSIERELLKRAYQYRGSDMPMYLVEAIEAELAKPEPEPAREPLSDDEIEKI